MKKEKAKKKWFGGSKEGKGRERSDSKSGSVMTGKGSVESVRSRDGESEDVLDRWNSRASKEEDWGIGDDVRMGLG
jgi:hypothetical protein